jgi:proteasome accessory factor B
VARRLAPEPTSEKVTLLVRENAGHRLRRDADSLETGVAGPDGASSWDRLLLTRATVGLADELLGHGADVYVEEPAALRDLMVTRLREAAGDAA